MSKRLHDNAVWRKKWFRELIPEHKLLWMYLKDECDISGVWSIDQEQAEFFINHKINWQKAYKELNDQIFIFKNKTKLLVIDFISFQYGELNPNSPVHRKVISVLSSHGLSVKILNRVHPTLSRTLSNRVQEEEEEEEEDKDKEEDRDKEEIKTWRTSFDVYKKIVDDTYQYILNEPAILDELQRLNPGLDIKLSLEKGIINFWGTEAGWKHKKKSRSNDIDMLRTLKSNLDRNKVYLQKRAVDKNCSDELLREVEAWGKKEVF